MKCRMFLSSFRCSPRGEVASVFVIVLSVTRDIVNLLHVERTWMATMSPRTAGRLCKGQERRICQQSPGTFQTSSCIIQSMMMKHQRVSLHYPITNQQRVKEKS